MLVGHCFELTTENKFESILNSYCNYLNAFEDENKDENKDEDEEDIKKNTLNIYKHIITI